MRQRLDDPEIHDIVVKQGYRYGTLVQVLGGAASLLPTHPPVVAFDTGGDERDVNLPTGAGIEGLSFRIFNIGEDEDDLVIKSGETTLVTLEDGEGVEMVRVAGAWRSVLRAVT